MSLRFVAPVVWSVVEEHLEEGAFLWSRWERSLSSPLYTIEESRRREERRVFAHVHGLIVGGARVAERILHPELESPIRERAATAAAALLGAEHGDELPRILHAFTGTEAPGTVDGLGRALEVSTRPDVVSALLAHLPRMEPGSAAHLRTLAILGARRADGGDALKQAFSHSSPEVRAAAARAAQGPARTRLTNYLLRLLSAPEPEVRVAAASSALVLGSKVAWEVCLALAAPEVAEAVRSEALLLVSLFGGLGERPLILNALEERVPLRTAFVAGGFSGWPEAADRCVPWIADEELGPLAGEALLAITGAGSASLESARREEPPGESEDEDLEENLGPSEDADLPNLDADRVEAWWVGVQSKLPAGTRLHRGRPWASGVLETFATEPTRRRHALAIAIAVHTRGAIDVPTRARAATQSAAAVSLASLDARQLARPAWIEREA